MQSQVWIMTPCSHACSKRAHAFLSPATSFSHAGHQYPRVNTKVSPRPLEAKILGAILGLWARYRKMLLESLLLFTPRTRQATARKQAVRQSLRESCSTLGQRKQATTTLSSHNPRNNPWKFGVVRWALAVASRVQREVVADASAGC